MKPFNWEEFVKAVESMDCKIIYNSDKEAGFYYNDELLYTFDELFPELYNEFPNGV